MQRKTFDAEYVRRLAESDPETERDFVAYFGELLSIKLRSRLRHADQVQDAAQETFLRVLRTIRQTGIETPEALGSYVNSVCTNVLFELYRSQTREAVPVEDRDNGKPSADQVIASAQERAEVRAVLAELPEKDRSLLRWLFFEERDKSEICRLLDVDREYLRVLVHRAKQRFRGDFLRHNATKSASSAPLG